MTRVKYLVWAFFVLLSLATGVAVWAQQDHRPIKDGQTTCPMKKIEVERLPDLNIPRSGHATVVAGGELTMVGGHTTGFVPTPTLEYFSDGSWHQVPLVYTHDNATVITLRSGKVLILGGSSEPLGIGQTFTAEMYDPATHHSEGFGCLDTKRALASAVEMDSDRVLIAGNWYHDDAIELFDGKKSFSQVKGVTQPRVCPYILPISNGDALIFGALSNKGETYDTMVVDRLKGAPLHVPLFNEWNTCLALSPFKPIVSFIGDEERGDYRYLLGVSSKQGGNALVEVRDTVFSLLPTLHAIPTSSPWEDIVWARSNVVLVDRKACRGYMFGITEDYFKNYGSTYRLYVLGIDYDRRQEGKVPITLYYTDPLPGVSIWSWAMDDNGDIIVSGGLQGDNFNPSSVVYRLLTGEKRGSSGGTGWWMVAGTTLGVAALAFIVVCLFRRRKKVSSVVENEEEKNEEEEGSDKVSDAVSNALLRRICRLMEDDRLFLNSDLTLSDVASALGTNRNVVSNCINQQYNRSFSLFVGEYRVTHAQQLILSQPDMKMTEVWMKSGFAAESSFFRMFKTITGMTPTEWKTLRSARK